MIEIEGVLHVHSTYSDGEFSLPELRDVFLADGKRFACVTDHAEAFDADKVSRYVAECARLSDDVFRFVPGLEFECERRLHILGYGCTTLAPSKDPEEVIAHIGCSGGVAVIAHPPDAHFEWIESFSALPAGIEAWNSKYDGRAAPRPQTYQLIDRLRRRAPGLLAFYGVDLHWKRQDRRLGCRVQSAELTPTAILTALAAGRYSGWREGVALPADRAPDAAWLARAGEAHRRASRVKHWARRAKGMLDRIGIRVPAGLKAELRRFF